MSVGRDVIANALDISEKEVDCSNCIYMALQYCNFWRVEALDGEFCSFFTPKGGDAE